MRVCVDGVFVWSCGVFFYVLFLNLSKLIIISCVSNSALHSLRLDKPQTKDRKRSRKIEHESDVCSQVTHLLFPYTQFIFVFIDFYRSFLLEICFFLFQPHTRTHAHTNELRNFVIEKLFSEFVCKTKRNLKRAKKQQFNCGVSHQCQCRFTLLFLCID